MKTAVWGNGEAYSLAHTQVRGVAAVCDPSGALFLPDLHMLIVSDLHLEKDHPLPGAVSSSRLMTQQRRSTCWRWQLRAISRELSSAR